MMRTIVDEQDAQACLSAAARSGETLQDWARRNLIDGRSLHAWRRRLERRASSTTPTKALVELVPATTPTSSARRYVLHVREASIELGDDFEAATLSRILEVLREC
jgi:transposase-like protein